jgi:hypothetical protein
MIILLLCWDEKREDRNQHIMLCETKRVRVYGPFTDIQSCYCALSLLLQRRHIVQFSIRGAMRLELSIREMIGHSITQDRGSEVPQGEAATRGTFLCKAHRRMDLRHSRDLVEPIVRPRVYMRARIDSSTGHVGDPRLPPLHTLSIKC